MEHSGHSRKQTSKTTTLSFVLPLVGRFYHRTRPSRRRPQGSGPVLIPARLPRRTPRHSAEPDVIDPADDAVRVRQPGQGTYFWTRAELGSLKLLSSYNWRDLKRYRKKKIEMTRFFQLVMSLVTRMVYKYITLIFFSLFLSELNLT